MDKAKKKALKFGVDGNFERLEYCCPKCGVVVPLSAKRCLNCRSKRPKDAYERAIGLKMEEEAKRAPKNGNLVPGTVCKRPLPKKLCYANPCAPSGCRIEPQPNPASCYASVEMQRMGIPKFYSTDEYGRVFEMPVSYKPLGVGGPVPVPVPAQTVQTTPIDVPVNFKV